MAEHVGATGRSAVDAAFERFASTRLPVVTIRGMFSSGTGWLRNLLTLNCPTQIQFMDPGQKRPGRPSEFVDADGLYGWKHAHFNTFERALFDQHPSHRMAILSRDAIAWAYSAFKMKAMMSGGTPAAAAATNFSLYIQSPARYPLNIGQSGPTLEGANVFEVRKHMYANVLNLTTEDDNALPAHRVHFFQYETMRNDSASAVMAMLRDFNLSCGNLTESTFKTQEYLVKMQVVSKKVRVLAKHAREEVCRVLRLNPGLYERMRASLDLEFERRVLGYEYDEHMEDYCPPPQPTPAPVPTLRPTRQPTVRRLGHVQPPPQQQAPPIKIIVHSSVEIVQQQQKQGGSGGVEVEMVTGNGGAVFANAGGGGGGDAATVAAMARLEQQLAELLRRIDRMEHRSAESIVDVPPPPVLELINSSITLEGLGINSNVSIPSEEGDDDDAVNQQPIMGNFRRSMDGLDAALQAAKASRTTNNNRFLFTVQVAAGFLVVFVLLCVLFMRSSSSAAASKRVPPYPPSSPPPRQQQQHRSAPQDGCGGCFKSRRFRFATRLDP